VAIVPVAGAAEADGIVGAVERRVEMLEKDFLEGQRRGLSVGV
jgi:hypothetical protein